MAHERSPAVAKELQKLEHRVQVIVTTSMMAILSMPHVSEVHVKETELLALFVDLFGEER